MDILLLCIVSILTVILLEGVLSIDNAVVIAMIANKAKPEDRDKVVKYGIIGAYALRGLSIFAIGWLMANPQWGGAAKFAGAIWLIKMGIALFTPQPEDDAEVPGWIQWIIKKLSLAVFAAVIIEVEIADFIFSIDNLFATVAMTEKIPGKILGMPLNTTICIIGVFLGIATMRVITVHVMKLIEKYPALNKSAAIVIFLLGVKLMVSALITLTALSTIAIIDFPLYTSVFGFIGDYIQPIKEVFESHTTDYVFSGLTLAIFFYPIIFKTNNQNA
jgi:YkoY family integral membrane protein